MRISTILLFASWIPLIQYLLFGIDFIFFPFTILLSIMGMWLFVKKLRKKVEPYKPIINFILLLFLSIILFGIHVFIAIVWLSKIDLSHHNYSDSSFGLILCIIPAAISCAALLLAWGEARKEEKPYIPVLKFISASVFVIWQLNLGFHFYIEMHESMLGIGYYSRWIGELMWLITPRQILSIGYIIVNVLFFSDILLKRKIKDGRDLILLPGAGLLMLSGTYMLIPLMVTAVKLFPETINITLFEVTLSFITIIGPVLIIAVILSGTGGILALFKGLRYLRFPASVRKGVIVSSITVILYVLLFKSIWPIRDPSMNVLIRMMKENAEKFRDECIPSFHIIVIGCHIELFSFGKSAQGLLIEKLNDSDAFIRRESAFFLEYIGDKRAIPSLITALKDRDEEVRRTAARSLYAIEDQRAIDPLIDTLKDENSFVVKNAAEVLYEKLKGNIPDSMKEKITQALLVIAWELFEKKHNIVVTLIDALKAENAMVVESGVVEVLSCFRDPMVVMALIEKLEGNIPDSLNPRINKILLEITGESYKGEPEEMWAWWRQWWDKKKVEFIKKNSTWTSIIGDDL